MVAKCQPPARGPCQEACAKTRDFTLGLKKRGDLEPVCMFDKLHLMFNFKSKISHDTFKNKNGCQLTSTFSSKMSPRCHMPSSTCHFNF